MSNKINIILTIIIILLVCYIAYDKLIDNDKNVENVSGIVSDKTLDNVKYYYYGKNIESDNPDEDRIYKSIYLFEDNTYYYGYSNKKDKCNYWSKGNYEYSNGYLILNEKKYGGCSTCYYTDNLKTYKFRNVNDTLVSVDNEMLTEAKLNILPVIDVENLEGVKHCTH